VREKIIRNKSAWLKFAEFYSAVMRFCKRNKENNHDVMMAKLVPIFIITPKEIITDGSDSPMFKKFILLLPARRNVLHTAMHNSIMQYSLLFSFNETLQKR